MTAKFSEDTRQTVKAWLDKVQNVKFHYYYKSKNKTTKE